MTNEEEHESYFTVILFFTNFAIILMSKVDPYDFNRPTPYDMFKNKMRVSKRNILHHVHCRTYELFILQQTTLL